MSKRGVKLYIEDMINAIEKIEKYTLEIKSFEEFAEKDIKYTIPPLKEKLRVILEEIK